MTCEYSESDKTAQRGPSNGPGRGARRCGRAVVGTGRSFGHSRVASFASPGDSDLISGKTRLVQLLDGGHRMGLVFENANHGRASPSYRSHEEVSLLHDSIQFRIRASFLGRSSRA